MLMATVDVSLIMTRVTAGILDENIIDKSLLLNLELRRNERRRNLRYRTSLLSQDEVKSMAATHNERKAALEAKSVDQVIDRTTYFVVRTYD